MNSRARWPEFLVPGVLLGCLFIIFMPLPAGILDFLLAANITAAIVILLTTLQVRRPMEMSLFPALLLGTTLARLALNISTTRLILTDGATSGDLAAGHVVQSFGQFVGGNNIAVGLVIFAIIIVIQFVVITKGASRISEVSARFSLDGMPGKQMSIDADLTAGIIDAEQAGKQREELTAQADFYGAMDGASKFVRGDAIAGILITLVNIAGGLVIGLASGMTPGGAAAVFTKLTIGDGLVTQIPALLIAMSAGILVSRSTRDMNLARESVNQIFSRPPVMFATAGFLCILMFTNLPFVPLALIAACCVIIGLVPANGAAEGEPAPAPKEMRSHEITIDRLLSNDVLEMELGGGLIRMADPATGGDLLGEITAVRTRLASRLGIILPKIRVRDNLRLSRNSYRILLHGNPVEVGELQPMSLLAIDRGNAEGPIDSESIEGVFDKYPGPDSAYWISPQTYKDVAKSGYEIQTPTDVLAERLESVSAKHAPGLLTLDATQQLVEQTRKSSPAAVDELIPGLMSLSEVQLILKDLLSEGVSIRPLGLIFECIGDAARAETNHLKRVRKVRKGLSAHIISQISQPGMPLSVFTIAEDLEHRIACAWEPEECRIRLNLDQEVIEGLVNTIEQAARKIKATGIPPIALVDQSIRPVIAALVERLDRDVIVLGTEETGRMPINVVGEITVEDVRAVHRPIAA